MCVQIIKDHYAVMYTSSNVHFCKQLMNRTTLNDSYLNVKQTFQGIDKWLIRNLKR